MNKRQDWIAQIKAHALTNYEKGWDVLVECWSDQDILDAVADCDTLEEAIAAIGETMTIMADYANEIRATEW